MPNGFAWIAVAAAATAVLASWAERQRTRRSNLDAVGFMPWPLIIVLASLVFAVSAGLALKTG